jgi:hypothetical protein
MEKIQNLFRLTEKWISILKRALFYVSSQKVNSNVNIIFYKTRN